MIFINSPLSIFSEPSNNKCSKKCANPVNPFSRSFPPTLYMTDVITTGAVLSWCNMTCNPLSSLNSVNSTCWEKNDIGKNSNASNIFFILIKN